MIAFPFVADGTEVDGVYWPQIPIGQNVWTLMSGPDEIIKYTKAWFTVIIDFVIRKASNYFTYCPNHPDIPYRTPGKGKKIKFLKIKSSFLIFTVNSSFYISPILS